MQAEIDIRVREGDELKKKYYKSTFKDTKKIIGMNKDFFNSLTEIKAVYILGHSLSEIDYDYFEAVFEKVSLEYKLFVTYYSQQDCKAIDNLVETLKIPREKVFKFQIVQNKKSFHHNS